MGSEMCIRDRFKARIKDGSDWSALNEATFSVGPVRDNLRITELMYHPEDTGNPLDPNAEFIELKNTGAESINLNLVRFTDGVDFTFGDLQLDPGEYVVVVKDINAFNARYPSFSGTIAGQYTGSLSNAGERITLEDAIGQTILDFGFKDGWYPITDGYGFSLNIINPSSSDVNEWEYAEYWQSSSTKGGSPGSDYSPNVAANGAIVINEVLAHTDDVVYGDWIELYNTTGSPVNIGGWFLSDDSGNLTKYEIDPADPRASVPAGGYVVFDSVNDFGNISNLAVHVPFALSELGETVYLSSGSGGELSGGFIAKEDFKASDNNVTFGRYTKSAASGYDVDFVAMSSATKGSANSGAKVGPVVISEIMYHPVGNTYAEYVELHNISGGTVTLYDPANPENTWLLIDETGGIEFYLPTGITMSAGQRILLVKNLGAFESVYGSPSVAAYQWLEGRLSNAGEKIELRKPGAPEPDGTVPYIRVDRVNYSDGRHPENFRGLPGDPWPTSADGGGDSLHRKVDTDYGNDVDNWQAGAPTPGS